MKYLGLILVCLVYFGCNKIELPIKMPDAPIFEVNALVGTKPFSLAAGRDNVILDTRFQQEELSVLKLIGELKKKDCVPPCPSSLRITLRQNNREFVSVASRPIKTGRRSFFITSPDSLMIQSKSEPILSNTGGTNKYSFNWTVNDKKISNRENIALNINPFVRNNVCMYLSHPDGSEASQCQAVDYNLADSFPGLKVNILARNVPNKGWMVVAETKGLGPFKYNWDNKSLEPTIELDVKKGGRHCVTVTDSRGNIASSCVDFMQEGKIKSQANFDLIYEPSRLKDLTQFNSVEIVYIDDQGFRYTSSMQSQPGNSFFEILEESPYEENDLKQATKKLKLNFDLLLYGANRPAVNFKGSGSIAVAYPK